MKRFATFTCALAAIFGSIQHLRAATVTLGSPVSDGVQYRWTVAMDASDSTGSAIIRHVGSLSFNDPINFSDPDGYFGWTHTSDWIALELTEPATLTIDVQRQAGVPNGAATAGDQLYPAFGIWSAWHLTGGDSHVYNNAGNFNWAPGLDFIGNVFNGVGATSANDSFVLPAGLYSIIVGGNPPTGTAASRQGYLVTLTTVAVPEPSSIVLGLCGGACLMLFALRRKR